MTDEEITRCQHSDRTPSDCDDCPDHARCAELDRAEYLRQCGPEPTEEIE